MSFRDDWNLSTFLKNNENAYIYNDDGEGENYTPELSTPERHFVVVSLVVIFITGIIVNIKIVVIATKNIRNGALSWMYILNNTIVQMLMLIVCLPTSAVTVKLTSWPFGNIMCKLINFLMSVFVAVDVMSLVAMVTENYHFIGTMLTNSFRTKKKMSVIVLAIWCTSLLTMTPRLSLYQVQDLLLVTEASHMCTRNFGPLTNRQVDTFIIFVFLYVVPGLLVICLNTRSYQALNIVAGAITEESDIIGHSLKEAKQIVRLSFLIGLTNLIGWLPVHVTSIVQEFYDYDILAGREVYTVCVFLATFAVCPIIILFGNRSHPQRDDDQSTLLPELKGSSFSDD